MIPELRKKKPAEILASVIVMLLGIGFLIVAIHFGTDPVYTIAYEESNGTSRVQYSCGTVFSGNTPSYEEYATHTYEQLICTRMLGRQGLLTYLMLGPGVVWLIGGFFSLFYIKPVFPEEVFKLSDKEE